VRAESDPAAASSAYKVIGAVSADLAWLQQYFLSFYQQQSEGGITAWHECAI